MVEEATTDRTGTTLRTTRISTIRTGMTVLMVDIEVETVFVATADCSHPGATNMPRMIAVPRVSYFQITLRIETGTMSVITTATMRSSSVAYRRANGAVIKIEAGGEGRSHEISKDIN